MPTGISGLFKNTKGAKEAEQAKDNKAYLYAARDTVTGELVSDITNPKRKYWDRKGNAQKAIDYYNRAYANRKLKPFDNRGEHNTLELVVFELVEVKK